MTDYANDCRKTCGCATSLLNRPILHRDGRRFPDQPRQAAPRPSAASRNTAFSTDRPTAKPFNTHKTLSRLCPNRRIDNAPRMAPSPAHTPVRGALSIQH